MEIKKENYIQISGELYTEVQSSGLFNDSKTFVDSIPRMDPEIIIDKYNSEKKSASFSLLKFVELSFILPEEKEVKVSLPENRTMREHIKLLWQYLKREVPLNQNKYSTLLPLPKPYIVPGGRFREIYYWDSYFTMQGLIADNEIKTIENMIDNFAHLINEFGFIPNGNRIYYLTRSQPPFFAPMIDLVCKHKKDYKWGLKYLNQLEREYDFWCGKSDHSVYIYNDTSLNRYFDNDKNPREESYFEDKEIANELSWDEKNNLFTNIRSACESGWDFSSRWFSDNESLKNCVTTEILPVDLNCLLYFLESFISRLNNLKGEIKKSKKFSALADKRAEFINKYFWNTKENYYCDYNFIKKKHTETFSLTAAYPLYFGIAEKKMAEDVKEKIRRDFLRAGGVTTTLNYTGQQWDAPNGWAPLQWITIKGLRKYGFNDLADKIKTRWLLLNENVFKRTGKMFEKYNVDDISLHAGGGEYPLQDGFGWTNGVASALLSNFDEI